MRSISKYLLLTTILAGVPMGAVAQEIETVTVTAQKRAQDVQDVPISMSVLTSEQLAKFQARDLKDVMNYIPNVYVERLNAADVIYIRGFGSPPGNFAYDQSVSMYQDGIYGGRGRQFEAPFFDLERIEVARGPQGALFGKNTPAGAITITTKGPTEKLEAGVTANYNFDLNGTEVQGYVSGPLSDTLGARIAIKTADLDGWVPNRTTNRKDPSLESRLARLTLNWKPAAGYEFILKAEYAGKEQHGTPAVLAPVATGTPITSDRFTDGNPLGRPEANKVTTRSGSLTGNIEIGDHTLTAITGYSSFRSWRANAYSTDVPARYTNSFPEAYDQISQEVRLLSPTGQTLEYVVGGYFDYSNYKILYQNNYNFPELGRSGQVHSDFNQNAYTYSVFGQATWNITDDFRAIGSLRYTMVDKDATFATTIDAVVGAPLRPVTSAAGNLSEDYVDPSITLQYDLTDDVMVYALYGKGSKSGGFVSNTFGTTNATFIFRPETSQSFEGGVKSTWLDGALIANLSIYRTEFKDLQVTLFDPISAAFVNRNAGKASSTGVEGQLVYKPVDSLTITASGAYQDAKYDDFPGAACLARQPVTCVAATNNIGGFPIPFSSNWTGNLQVDYVYPLTEGMKLTTTVATNYRSKYFNADNQSFVYGVQPGYAKWDFRMQVADVDDKWDFALVGKNIFDIKTYAFSTFFAAPITLDPRVHKWLEEPRTISLEASLRL